MLVLSSLLCSNCHRCQEWTWTLTHLSGPSMKSRNEKKRHTFSGLGWTLSNQSRFSIRKSRREECNRNHVSQREGSSKSTNAKILCKIKAEKSISGILEMEVRSIWVRQWTGKGWIKVLNPTLVIVLVSIVFPQKIILRNNYISCIKK